MNNIGSIFENLYRQFILRDLLAKIMPGFILLISTMHLLFFPLKRQLYLTAKLVFWQWLFLFAFAWVIGFVIQHGGILAGHLKDETYRLRKEQKKSSLIERFRIKKAIYDTGSDDFKKALERAIVIKEACGNTSFALLCSIPLALLRFLLGLALCRYYSLLGYFFGNVFLIIAMSVSALVLLNCHNYHAEREEMFRDSIRDEEKEEKN